MANKFSLNILPDIKLALDACFVYIFFASEFEIYSLSQIFLKFSSVFPKPELFINLKKSFSKAFFASFLFFSVKINVFC